MRKLDVDQNAMVDNINYLLDVGPKTLQHALEFEN